MKQNLAIATLAVASAFSGAADAHDRHHGPYDPYYSPYAPPIVVLPPPPPVYRPAPRYAPPPAIEVDCRDIMRFDRRTGYEYSTGSIRTYEDNYGRVFKTRDPRPCF